MAAFSLSNGPCRCAESERDSRYPLTDIVRRAMTNLRACDVVPISEARARLTELADEVPDGAERVLTKNGTSFVTLVDSKKLDYYQALEVEHANLALLDEAEAG